MSQIRSLVLWLFSCPNSVNRHRKVTKKRLVAENLALLIKFPAYEYQSETSSAYIRRKIGPESYCGTFDSHVIQRRPIAR